MENNIPSTTYVPLQPPYKIIKFGNRIGVQIGTQRVTIVGGSPLKMETHNYPVVAAEDRLTALQGNNFSIDSSSEGEVWDNVESKRVSVLCELGTQLSWQDFIKILWHDLARLGNGCEKIQKYYIYHKLISYNKCMQLPSPGWYTIHLHTEPSEGTPKVVRSAEDDTFALNVQWVDDPAKLEKLIEMDLVEYLTILSPCRSTRWWRMNYETNEDCLRPLVDRLNANVVATSFRNKIMGVFHIRALHTYDEKTGIEEGNPAESNVLDKEKHGEFYYGKDICVFHDNLDTDKIATAIRQLDRSLPSDENGKKNDLNIRPFVFVLYNVFKDIHWLSKEKRTDFVAWFKFKCQYYFESKDVEKIKLDEALRKKVAEYKEVFVTTQANGKIIDKRDRFFKKDSMGNPLEAINTGI